MKKLSNLLGLLAVLLTNLMCVVVAFSYADMLCAIEHRGASAPASVVFLFAVPFLILIGVCVAVALILRKRGK